MGFAEIKDLLQPHEKTADRPDLVNRVFRIKLKAILKDLKQNQLFGRTVASFHVVEFQKRGLPHAHILITLHQEDKPTTTEEINSMITAEIPNPTLEPELYEIVKRVIRSYFEVRFYLLSLNSQ